MTRLEPSGLTRTTVSSQVPSVPMSFPLPSVDLDSLDIVYVSLRPTGSEYRGNSAAAAAEIEQTSIEIRTGARFRPRTRIRPPVTCQDHMPAADRDGTGNPNGKSERIRLRRQVLETRRLVDERQLHRTGRAVALLGDDDLG